MIVISAHFEICVKQKMRVDKFIPSTVCDLQWAIFDLISLSFAMAAKQINHHTAPDLCYGLLCVRFTSSITGVVFPLVVL